ncbi:MAG: hypothetical protein Q9M15_02330 [Mariprofundaceae bacterium]|nr:hypothetical protein [Mariprofundaceae bacterium]
MVTSVILVLISFVWLALAWFFRKVRFFHIPAMMLLVVFDLFFPVYLYLTHDWWQRLIVHQEALSFAVWSHLILIIVLYSLYVLQIMAGRGMMQTQGAEYKEHQHDHAQQFMGILIVRTLVFASGALLIVPAGTQ